MPLFPVPFSIFLLIYKDIFNLFIIHHFSERALLNRLMIELHKLDSDVLVGHNISGFDLDVLLHRVQVLLYFLELNFMFEFVNGLLRHFSNDIKFIGFSFYYLDYLN